MVRRMFVMTLAFLTLAVSAQTRMISHVTSPTGGFTTTVIIENNSVVAREVVLTPYTASGDILTVQNVSLVGLETLQKPTSELFGEDNARVAYFTIGDDDEVTVSVNYTFEDGQSSPANVLASSERASNWRFFPGNWELGFDGLALVNTGTAATDIWVHQKNGNNEILASRKVVTGLAPNAKTLYVVGSPNDSPFEAIDGAFFEVVADQAMAVTALGGTLAGSAVGLLWGNNTRNRSQATSTRDELGVWFIKNGSLYDVMEMMGHNVAYDRLWQLELSRRNSRGKMAEIFGRSLLNNDVVVRRIGYTDEELDAHYAALDTETRIMIDAHLHGINRRIAEVNSLEKDVQAGVLSQAESIMPYEFKVFDFSEIAYWDYKDILCWISVAQRSFTIEGLGFEQVDNLSLALQLLDSTGDPVAAEAMFDDMRWVNDAKSPTMIPFDASKARQKPQSKNQPWKFAEDLDIPKLRNEITQFRNGLLENRRQLQEKGAFLKGGSYAWVVGADRTESGNPTLYSGPQLGQGAPIAICEGSIESEALTVSGMVVPGIPGIVVGRTPHHSWSFQVGHAHCWDFYRESEETVTLHRTEMVGVAGEEDVAVDIYRSDRGIVMTNMPWLSWVYAHRNHDFELSKGLLNLARSQSIDEFHGAVENLGLSQHILYADVDKNIGYWMSGRVPVRPEGNYKLPQGFAADPIIYDPEVINPVIHDRNTEQGWYGGWNNKASLETDDGPAIYWMGTFHRAHVIQDYLRDNSNLSFEEVRDLNIDITHTTSFSSGGIMWLYVKDKFLEAIANNPTPERQAIVDLINSWHTYFPAGEREDWISSEFFHEANIFQRQWILTTLINTFDDELGIANTLREADIRLNVLLHALDENPDVVNNQDWFLNASDPDAPQTAEAAIVKGLDDAIANLGPRPVNITRGNLTYQHTVLGVLHTVPFASRSDYGMCVEMGPNGPSRIESFMATGQSGTILSDDTFQPLLDANFLSFCDLYKDYIHRPFPLFGSGGKAKKEKP